MSSRKQSSRFRWSGGARRQPLLWVNKDTIPSGDPDRLYYSTVKEKATGAKISVGSAVLLKHPNPTQPPYAGLVEEMWEESNKKWVLVRWLYRPGDLGLKVGNDDVGKHELYHCLRHRDVNSLESVLGLCPIQFTLKKATVVHRDTPRLISADGHIPQSQVGSGGSTALHQCRYQYSLGSDGKPKLTELNSDDFPGRIFVPLLNAQSKSRNAQTRPPAAGRASSNGHRITIKKPIATAIGTATPTATPQSESPGQDSSDSDSADSETSKIAGISHYEPARSNEPRNTRVGADYQVEVEPFTKPTEPPKIVDKGEIEPTAQERETGDILQPWNKPLRWAFTQELLRYGKKFNKIAAALDVSPRSATAFFFYMKQFPSGSQLEDEFPPRLTEYSEMGPGLGRQPFVGPTHQIDQDGASPTSGMCTQCDKPRDRVIRCSYSQCPSALCHHCFRKQSSKFRNRSLGSHWNSAKDCKYFLCLECCPEISRDEDTSSEEEGAETPASPPLTRKRRRIGRPEMVVEDDGTDDEEEVEGLEGGGEATDSLAGEEPHSLMAPPMSKQTQHRVVKRHRARRKKAKAFVSSDNPEETAKRVLELVKETQSPNVFQEFCWILGSYHYRLLTCKEATDKLAVLFHGQGKLLQVLDGLNIGTYFSSG